MLILQPQVLVPATALDENILHRLERYARICYKSEDRLREQANYTFLTSIISRGHESVIEHEKITAIFIIDRGVSHELVRHRIASYSQESTRYCNYSQEKFGSEISVIEPYFLQGEAYTYWRQSCEAAETAYLSMLEAGCTPQEARTVLPNSLKTEIAVTFNLREWKHFFTMRCNPAAHPQMRQVAIPLLRLFQTKLAVIFDGIECDDEFPRQNYAEVILTDEMFNPLDGELSQ